MHLCVPHPSLGHKRDFHVSALCANVASLILSLSEPHVDIAIPSTLHSPEPPSTSVLAPFSPIEICDRKLFVESFDTHSHFLQPSGLRRLISIPSCHIHRLHQSSTIVAAHRSHQTSTFIEIRRSTNQRSHHPSTIVAVHRSHHTSTVIEIRRYSSFTSKQTARTIIL